MAKLTINGFEVEITASGYEGRDFTKDFLLDMVMAYDACNAYAREKGYKAWSESSFKCKNDILKYLFLESEDE